MATVRINQLAICVLLWTAHAASAQPGVSNLPLPPMAHTPSGPDVGPPPEEAWNRFRLYDPQAFSWLPVFAKVISPPGSKITFLGPDREHSFGNIVTVGLRATNTYLFAWTNIEQTQDQQRFFGTIEVVRSLRHPPEVRPSEIAVPIRLTEADLLALTRRQMVTKVVVLEHPDKALVEPASATEPIVVDTLLGADPFETAKEIGKIVLVVRLGTRVPLADEMTVIGPQAFLVPHNITTYDGSGKELPSRTIFHDAATGQPFPIQAVTHFKRSGSPAHCGPGMMGCDPTCIDMTPYVTEAIGPPPPTAIRVDCRLWKEDGYLHDGGDAERKAGRNLAGNLVNVNPGDTIAEYQELHGRRRTVESNVVCIYAPRFTEVRMVQAAEGQESLTGPQDLARDQKNSALVAMRADLENKQYERPVGIRTRERASEMLIQQSTDVFDEVRMLEGYSRSLGWAATIAAIEARTLTDTEREVVQSQLDVALQLSQEQSPRIVGVLAGANEIVAQWYQGEVVGLKEGVTPPGRLKLIKRASTTTAQFGDVIDFSIEYKNVGNQTIQNVAVTDSLITRLEYVADSAKSSREAVFTAAANDAGSHILRWELKNPLKPNESGEVRFQAKVR